MTTLFLREYYIKISKVQLKTFMQSSKVKAPSMQRPKPSYLQLFTNLTKNEEQLQILLKFEDHSHYYQTTLKNGSLPANLSTFFENVANVYDCLQDKEMYHLNAEKGQILIRVTFKMKEKQIVKEMIIQLEKVRNDHGQIIYNASMVYIKELEEKYRNEIQMLSEKITYRDERMRQLEKVTMSIMSQMMEVRKNQEYLMRVYPEMRAMQNQKLIIQCDKQKKQLIHTLNMRLVRFETLAERFLSKEVDKMEKKQESILKQYSDQLNLLGSKTEIQENKLNYLLQSLEEKKMTGREEKKEKRRKQMEEMQSEAEQTYENIRKIKEQMIFLQAVQEMKMRKRQEEMGRKQVLAVENKNYGHPSFVDSLIRSKAQMQKEKEGMKVEEVEKKENLRMFERKHQEVISDEIQEKKDENLQQMRKKRDMMEEEKLQMEKKQQERRKVEAGEKREMLCEFSLQQFKKEQKAGLLLEQWKVQQKQEDQQENPSDCQQQ